ncbi:MAG TPA: glycosyltransferase family 2 protein, partial [Bradyrhizobium sp.]
HRARLGWLLKRSFRSGQTHGRVLLAAQGRKPALIAIAAAKCAYCTIAMLLRVPWPARWRGLAVRAALHAGVVSRLAGISDLELY